MLLQLYVKRLFLELFSLEAKPFTIDQIREHTTERAVNVLSGAISSGTQALLVVELCVKLSKTVEISKI